MSTRTATFKEVWCLGLCVVGFCALTHPRRAHIVTVPPPRPNQPTQDCNRIKCYLRDILHVDTEKRIVRTEPLVDMRCVCRNWPAAHGYLT